MRILFQLAASTALFALSSPAALAKPKLINFDQPHVPGEFIVKFKHGSLANTKESLFIDLNAKILHHFDDSNTQLIKLQDPAALESHEPIPAPLMNHPDVEYIEANIIIKLDQVIPNDHSYTKLYAFPKISMPDAWKVTTGSHDVLAAVIDTGIDYKHPDIAPNYWQNPGEIGFDDQGRDKRSNGIDDDDNGYVDDYRGWNFADDNNDPLDTDGHGTHCAGTIGGAGNNSLGVVGINWHVSLLGLKVFAQDGSSSLSKFAEAIEYATRIGAKITNNSWGGSEYSPTLYEAIQKSGQKGVLFVAAAGNSQNNNDASPIYPASYNLDNVIAVAATTQDDKLAYFSNYGAKTVHLAAPGQQIFSTAPKDQYKYLSGTSMAAPHVAGAAALIKAAYPAATALEIKNRLLFGSDPMAHLAAHTIIGGRLNVHNAIENDTVAPGLIQDFIVKETTTHACQLSWQKAGDDGSSGEALRYDLRYSDRPIDSEAAWEKAAKATWSYTADANQIHATVTHLPLNQTGYFAIKAIDNVGNVGPLSSNLLFGLIQTYAVYTNGADSMDLVTGEAPWGQETLLDGRSVFSESPQQDFPSHATKSLVFGPFAVDHHGMTLQLAMKWSLGSYQNQSHAAYIEVCLDDCMQWQALDQLPNRSSSLPLDTSPVSIWLNKNYDLTRYLAGAKQFKVRFRLNSGAPRPFDNLIRWYIDDFTLYAHSPL